MISDEPQSEAPSNIETSHAAAGPPPQQPPAGWDAPAPAFGSALASGRIRSTPEDFQVIEDLGFETSGDGDYVFLRIRKREANTQYVAKRIGQAAGVPPKRVNYAGQKDRHAVTEQTFSVLLPGRHEIDWSALEAEPGIEILEVARNRRMVRRGGLSGNSFRIVIREMDGRVDAESSTEASNGPESPAAASEAEPRLPVDRAAIEARLSAIQGRGLPNYFGPQRFGHGGGNLPKALALFEGRRHERDRFKRGMYISAARSWLFNLVLAARVEAGTWDAPLAGDALMLQGSRSFFKAPEIDAEIRRRAAEMDIHPTGPLWGRGEPLVTGEVLALESAVLAPQEAWRKGLESVGTKQERRALRLPVKDLSWEWLGDDALALAFTLPPGAYATTVLGALGTFV